MLKRYAIAEIFPTIQGEGLLTGLPAIFVRFAGCNLACQIATGQGFDCDTDFRAREHLTKSELLSRVQGLLVEYPGSGIVVLTGGEPLLQVDEELAEGLKRLKVFLTCETNGTVVPPAAIDFVSCSPKRESPRPVILERADEVRIVVGKDTEIPRFEDLPRSGDYFLSPAFDGNTLLAENVRRCVDLVQKDPKWRLSLQTHKLIGIP